MENYNSQIKNSITSFWVLSIVFHLYYDTSSLPPGFSEVLKLLISSVTKHSVYF
jgi:hypothetical protein